VRLLLALDGLDATAVAAGVADEGLPSPDVYDPTDGLDATFDARLRAAFAVVVGEPVLDRGTLRGRVTGEIATRARQAGVPCHVIAGRDALDPMGKRILDLQYVVQADTPAALRHAGALLARRLTRDVLPD
jgi:Glycerate kinase family